MRKLESMCRRKSIHVWVSEQHRQARDEACAEQAAGAGAATPCQPGEAISGDGKEKATHSSLLAEDLLRSHIPQPFALLVRGRAAPQTSAML